MGHTLTEYRGTLEGVCGGSDPLGGSRKIVIRQGLSARG